MGERPIVLGTPGFAMTADDVRKYIDEAPEFANLSRAAKADKALKLLGVKRTKQIYATKEERKAAQKVRRKDRKMKATEELEKLGLAPKARGPKMTKEERQSKRRVRAGGRREFLRQQALLYPELARQYGLDPDRIKALVGKTKPKKEVKVAKKKAVTKKKKK